MPDPTQTDAPVEPTAEQTAGEIALELATESPIDPLDAVMDAAGLRDGDGDDDETDLGEKTDAEAKAPEPAGADLTDEDGSLEAGIAELAKMPGMTSERAKRLLAADPDLVREYGRDALAKAADAAPTAEEPTGTEPEKPAEPATPDATLEEILGATLDRDERDTIIKALDHQKKILMAEFKKLVPDLGGISKQLSSFDGAVSELYGRRVVDEMATDFPELKERGAYEKVHEKAVSMRKAGSPAPLRDLIEMAVIALHGGKARAEVQAHRQKITRAKTAGAPSTPKGGDPVDTTSQADKDWDRIWEKAQRR